MNKLFEKIFPIGTKRRGFMSTIYRIISVFKPSNIKRFFSSLSHYGFKKTLIKSRNAVAGNSAIQIDDGYEDWIKFNSPTEKEIEEERNFKFQINPKISIIVPMYETPVNFFEELVNNMIGQTYSNWELCLADRKS